MDADGTLKSNAISSPEIDYVESMPIVPVILKSSYAEIITYAMLDNCSTRTSVLEDLLENLKIDGVESNVLVKTMNVQQLHDVKVVKGLMVTDD